VFPNRQKHSKCNVVTIQDLKGLKVGNVFHGDVIVIYKTTIDRVHNIDLLRLDLVNEKGEMPITVNVPHTLIPVHESKIIHGQGVCIEGFKISPKTMYGHGDCNCILVLHDRSILETISPICQEYKFLPNTTIRQLTTNKSTFSIGTIASLVTYAKQLGSQYVLEIKDGHLEEDKTIVSTNPLIVVFSHLHTHLLLLTANILTQYLIASLPFFHIYVFLYYSTTTIIEKRKPMLLFRNVVKGREEQTKTLRTCKSTFITTLKEK
jgi:hypothetical protein